MNIVYAKRGRAIYQIEVHKTSRISRKSVKHEWCHWVRATSVMSPGTRFISDVIRYVLR